MKLSVCKIKRIVYNGPNDVRVGGGWLKEKIQLYLESC